MILVTDAERIRRDAVAEMLYYMGILAYSAAPEEIEGELGERYSALLFTSVEGIADAEELATRARTAYGMTTAAVTEEPSAAYDVSFPLGMYSSAIASGIGEYRLAAGLPPLGSYLCGGFDASADKPAILYRGSPITLTRTETMILRYIVRTYPEPASPADILKYAFRSSRVPELSSVRTHISVMNKKFRRATGRALTEACGGIGYLLVAQEKEPLTV